MRIVIDLQACQNGSRLRGIGRYAMALSRSMIKLGKEHDFFIVLNSAFADASPYVRRAFDDLLPQDRILTFHSIDHATAADPGNAWRNRGSEIVRANLLNSLSPDVVFIPSLFEGFWDRTTVSVEASVNYLTAVTLLDLIPLEDVAAYLGDGDGQRAYFRRLHDLRRADLILPISEYVAWDAGRRLGIAREKMNVVMCGVDEQFRRIAADDRTAALLTKYGISRPYVVTAAPLEPRKNIEGLIAGFGAMAPDVRDRHQLMLVGKMDDFARRYIRGLARNEGIRDDSIILPGFVPDDDLVILYSNCQAFAFPSFSEGFGLPVLEAMACGAPVIGSGTTSIPEVIGRDDLLVDPRSAQSIAQGLQRILSDADLRAELREYGVERARMFNWESSGRQALTALEDLVARKSTLRAVSAVPIIPEAPATIALVIPYLSPESHLTGVGLALAAALTDHVGVTIFHGAGQADGQWIAANCAVYGLNEFPRQSQAFDQALFLCDADVDADYHALIRDYGGAVLFLESDTSQSDAKLIGPNMGFMAQRGLFDRSGFSRFQAASEGKVDIVQVRDAILSSFEQIADGLLVEGPEGVGILPVNRSFSVRTSFRLRMNVSEQSQLLVFVMASADTVTAVLQFARQQASAWPDMRVIIVSPNEDVEEECSTTLFGDIVHLRTSLDSVYRGLVSAADFIVTDYDSSSLWRQRFATDLPSTRLLSWSERSRLHDCVGAVSESEAMEYASPQAKDVTGIAIESHSASVIAQWLTTVGRGRRKELKSLGEQFPPMVRGVAPTASDLADVANAMVANEAVLRGPYLLIDVTAFAGVGKNIRLDKRRQRWLRALFSQADLEVRAVYLDGNRIVEANRFIAGALGVRAPAIADEDIFVRAGDRLVGFDLWPCFGGQQSAAIEWVQSLGVSLHYVSLYESWPRNVDLFPALAEAILNWVRRPARFRSTVSYTAEAVFSVEREGVSGALDPRVIELIDRGIVCQMLLTPRQRDGEWLAANEIVEAPLSLAAAQVFAQPINASLLPSKNVSISSRQYGHVITGHLLGSYSLAIINRTMAMTLEQRLPGHVRYLPVETVPIDHTEGVPEDQKSLMIELSQRPVNPGKAEVVISNHYPVLPPTGNYALRLALFFWEESRVPIDVIARLAENFDGIISPSQVVTRALLDSGLPIPIATIGQPVNVDQYRALAPSRKRPSSKISFLHVSSCFKRKGVDILLAAWGRAFTSADNVRLIVKTFPNPHNDIDEQIKSLRGAYPDLAEILVINEDAAQKDMPKYYAMADVMVLPSRGEGYNLPALEAMASGLPLIVTGHGGQRDFCSEREARLIRYCFVPTESHVGSSHSLWVEPDVDDLVDALREHIDPAYVQEIESRRLAAMTAAVAESDPDAWMGRYDAMISDLLGRDDVVGSPKVAWISTWAVQCGIAQYSSYLIDHFSREFRSGMTVICDTRTQHNVTGIQHDAVWNVLNVPKVEKILSSIERSGADAVVLQHQDGLLSWEQLGELTHSERLNNLATVLVLHNAGNMMRTGEGERAKVLDGLRKMSRVLVHNIADLEMLSSLGLTENIGLLPHGAFASQQAPWPRKLSTDDAPIIGCHGFFFRHKGIDKLILAVALLRKRWPKVRLRLVNARFPDPGHDHYIAECKALASQLGIADAVEWYQDFLPITEVNQLLASCDVIALPYEESDDSASGAVRVALASMVPLVATRVKIFAELQDAAHWAQSNSPERLAEAIGELLESPDRRRGVQSAMHEWLAAHDWGAVASTLEGMITGLATQKRLGWEHGRDI